MNGTQDTNLRTASINQSIKQDDLSFISILEYPLTRWVKLSLNFELQVYRVMKILLGQRLFNNNIFFVQLELFRIQEITMLQNKIK